MRIFHVYSEWKCYAEGLSIGGGKGIGWKLVPFTMPVDGKYLEKGDMNMSIIFITITGTIIDLIINGLEALVVWKYKHTHNKRKSMYK